jgi:hypothetical protein
MAPKQLPNENSQILVIGTETQLNFICDDHLVLEVMFL